MSSSSESSPSRPSSPASETAPLDALISYLLASKRSLSSITHVLRANELVTSNRKALETEATTTARTKFLRSGIDEQVKVLDQVQASSENVGSSGKAEFAAIVKSLDEADRRLKVTLQSLRDTFVEAAIRPEGEEKRNLLDFVDETGVEALMAQIRESVVAAGQGHDGFADTNRSFGDEVSNVKHLLQEGRPGKSSVGVNNGESPLSKILEIMEDSAQEMAENLESLVKHFDLCVSAIRQTEGGGDAAQRLAGDLPEGVGLGEDVKNTSPEPIGEEERKEMLEVIEKDAEQVDEVVIEIRSRIAEMDNQHEIVVARTEARKEIEDSTMSAFTRLNVIGQRLPAFIAQSQVYLMRWEEEKTRIGKRMEELEGLREFYDGYFSAYDNLLLEISRRKALEVRMEKVVQDARDKIGRFYEADIGMRDAFKKEQGDFLPVDIWPSMTEDPVRYEISPVNGGGNRVPEISRSVVEQAFDRVSRRV